MSKNSPSVAVIDMSKFIQPNLGACCGVMDKKGPGVGVSGVGGVRVQPYKHSQTATHLLLIIILMHIQCIALNISSVVCNNWH